MIIYAPNLKANFITHAACILYLDGALLKMKNEDIIKLFENEFFLRLLDNRTNRNQINDPQKSSENLES